MRRTRSCAALWLLALIPLAAPAQRPDTLSADTVPAARRTPVLAPVTVSALGGVVPLARVPYAVSLRLPSAGARAALPTAVDDVLRGVPGLVVDDRANIALGERLSLRGFGARTQFGVRGVRVEIDGVPATMPDGQTTLSHVDPSTIVRTEVFRGAASALFGNAAGGAVRMWTEAPLDATGRADAAYTAGERGSAVTRAGAAGGRGALRGSFHASRFDYRGYRRRSDARTDRFGGRLMLAGARDTLSVVAATADYDAANPGALPAPLRSSDPRSASPTSIAFLTGERGRHRQAGLLWLRGGERWSATTMAYGLARDVWSPIPTRVLDLERGAGGVRGAVEVRFGGPARPWGLAWGAEAGIQRDSRRTYANVGGQATTVQLDQREAVDALGAHARLLAPLPAGMDLVAALRGDRIAFRVDDRRVAPGDPDDSGERAMAAISPTLGLTRTVGGATLFANASTAFESPTTSELANQPSGAGGLNRELRPQRLTAVEAGARLGGRRAGTVAVAVYAARLRDALVPFELPASPGRQFYRNASRATHRGVELEASGPAGGRAVWRVAAAAIDARFAPDDSAGANRAGHRVPGVAPWSGDAALQIAASGWLELEAVARGRSAMPVSDTSAGRSPGRIVADLRLLPAAWTAGGVSIGAALAVENVFDSPYDGSVVVNAARDRFYEPGPPRTVSVTVRVRWSAARDRHSFAPR